MKRWLWIAAGAFVLFNMTLLIFDMQIFISELPYDDGHLCQYWTGINVTEALYTRHDSCQFVRSPL